MHKDDVDHNSVLDFMKLAEAIN